MGMGPGGRQMGPRGQMNHERMMARGHRMEMMAEKLELTAEQKAQMEKLRTGFQLQMVDRQAAVRKAQINLRALMRDDKALEADVHKGIEEVARLRADIAKARFTNMRAMQKILTDKQREELKSMRMGHGPMFGMGDADDDDGENEDGPDMPDGPDMGN
jgi:Spy/CpxP family protein refolding chaperone